MIAIIFEVKPADGRMQDYLDFAARMRPPLSKVDGFISVERCQSFSDPDKYLSPSFSGSRTPSRLGEHWMRIAVHRKAGAAESSTITDYVWLALLVTTACTSAPDDSNLEHDT